MPETIFIGLGSNLGEPAENLLRAFDSVSRLDGVERPLLSPLYKTPPYGIVDQPEFVNAAARFETTLPPRAVLNSLLTIEEQMGRIRKEKWGPRLIDLDLLFYGDRVIEEEKLTIPHPEIHKRDFVLVPLADIAPNWQHPVLGKKIHELLSDMKDISNMRQIESDG